MYINVYSYVFCCSCFNLVWQCDGFNIWIFYVNLYFTEIGIFCLCEYQMDCLCVINVQVYNIYFWMWIMIDINQYRASIGRFSSFISNSRMCKENKNILQKMIYWLFMKLLLCNDIELNPGPTLSNLKNMSY